MLFFCFLNMSCEAPERDPALMDYDHDLVPYEFYNPNKISSLHYDLEEISGLSFFSEGQLFAVQDEKGKLFVIEQETGSILSEIKFGKSGDYEGVELVGDEIFVVKSNGQLISFSLQGEKVGSVQEIDTDLTSKNDVEGLSMLHGELVLICKASGELKKNKVNGKAAYRFDIEQRKLIREPLFTIRQKKLKDFVQNKTHFKVIDDFDPSGIAQHPISKDIYVLSADRVLAVLTPAYELKEVVKLDRSLYKQPEGICFLPDGTLYISNEGGGARGKLVELSYLKR